MHTCPWAPSSISTSTPTATTWLVASTPAVGGGLFTLGCLLVPGPRLAATSEEVGCQRRANGGLQSQTYRTGHLAALGCPGTESGQGEERCLSCRLLPECEESRPSFAYAIGRVDPKADQGRRGADRATPAPCAVVLGRVAPCDVLAGRLTWIGSVPRTPAKRGAQADRLSIRREGRALPLGSTERGPVGERWSRVSSTSFPDCGLSEG
ncbi:hypothetical protein BH09VER1_BH09VER1_47690 [soil metagenome]